MGPHPHLVSVALKEIEKMMPASQVTEKIVMGKVMELKGIQLQKGLTEKRMGYVQDPKDLLDNDAATNPDKGKGKSKQSSPSKSQTELLLEVAEKYLKEHGLDQLDPEKFQRAIMDYVQGKTLQELQTKRGITPKPEEPMLIVSDSDGEESWHKTDSPEATNKVKSEKPDKESSQPSKGSGHR